jgi:uncharacterized membrane protein YjjB (DUF3815 family)
MAIYAALMKRGCLPDLVAATLGAMLTLGVGVLANTIWHRHRTLAFINFIASFILLVVGLSHGGDFNPDNILKVFRLASILP